MVLSFSRGGSVKKTLTPNAARFFLYIFLSFLFSACGALRGCSGCSACGDDDRLAELTAVKKAVHRDFAASVEKWKKARVGDGFRVGDGLKTGKGATARLKLIPEGRMLVQSETVVRFQQSPPGEKSRRVRLQSGNVEIESAGAELQLHTVVGLARIERGSRVRLRSSDRASRLEVLVGGAQIDRDGEIMAVASGEQLELEIGGVVIDRDQEQQTQAEAQPQEETAEAASDETGEAEAEQADDEAEAPFRGPERADLGIPAGESATFHDPSPPTNVLIDLKGCESGGVVEVKRANRRGKYSAVRGEKSVVIQLPAGSYLYRVRCLQDGKLARRATARGRLRVQKDAGLMRLPKRPPSITLDADGRTYTVRYQNRLPKITMRWPDPPAAKAYTLQISSRSGKQTKSFAQPRVTFESGELAEGTHRFVFGAANGGSSPSTTLRVAFDNMARTASLSDPIEGKAAAGQKARVAGTALTGSRVSVAGKPLKTDSQGRFKTELTAPADRTAVSVRVQHRATRIHYYLRNLSGGP